MKNLLLKTTVSIVFLLLAGYSSYGSNIPGSRDSYAPLKSSHTSLPAYFETQINNTTSQNLSAFQSFASPAEKTITKSNCSNGLSDSGNDQTNSSLLKYLVWILGLASLALTRQAFLSSRYAFLKLRRWPVVFLLLFFAINANGQCPPTITADYCILGNGQVRLTATSAGATSFQWNTGQTGSVIAVPGAGIYTVTVNTPGCNSPNNKASINVGADQVVNGNFSAGNGVGFTSNYAYRATGPINDQGEYAVRPDASPLMTLNGYHFWGWDHTVHNGLSPNNFLALNGADVSNVTIWSEPVNVVAGTNYYFSAWAMDLLEPGHGQLPSRMRLNITVPSTAPSTTEFILPFGVASSNNPWYQYTKVWNSPYTGTVTISISEPFIAYLGNNFGLDDISFSTLNPVPLSVTTPPINPICVGGTINLTATVTGGNAPLTYQWTGPNSYSSNLQNPPPISNATTAMSGPYTLTVTDASGLFQNSTGNCSKNSSVVVTVNTLPVTPTITAGGPLTLCTGGSVTLTSSAGTTYLWSTGGTTQSITVSTAGSYTVRVTNAAGCQSAASAPAIVTVSPFPAAPTITAGGPLTFCPGGSVTLTSSAGTTYLWSTGATTQNITVSTAGNYTVRVTNAAGCQSAASAPAIVTVNALPATPTISAGGPLTFCAGGSVTLTSSAGTTYKWSTGATTQSIIVTATGSYTVQVTNAAGCLSAASAPTVVTVNTLPATPTISSIDCSGGSGHANFTVTNALAGYQYSLNGGPYQGTSFTNIANGTYSLVAKNLSGCISPAALVNVDCSCGSLPTLTLTSTSRNTDCSTAITVNGNTFGGSATSVTGSPLPNGSGTLNITINPPSSFNFTYNPVAADAGKTVTITFTTNAGSGCFPVSSTYSLTVAPQVTPTFNAVPAICSGGSLSALPTTSNNGITGTWGPALDNTTTTIYTFSPTAGQCAASTTLTITVNAKANPTFTQVSDICKGGILNALPTTSNNGISGTWSPALNNNATTTYTFTPSPWECANPAMLTINVNPLPVVSNVSGPTPVCPNENASFSIGTLVNVSYQWQLSSDNGST